MVDLARGNSHFPRGNTRIAIDIDALASITRIRTDNERIIANDIAIFAGVTIGTVVPPQVIVAIDAVTAPIWHPNVSIFALISCCGMVCHQVRRGTEPRRFFARELIISAIAIMLDPGAASPDSIVVDRADPTHRIGVVVVHHIFDRACTRGRPEIAIGNRNLEATVRSAVARQALSARSITCIEFDDDERSVEVVGLARHITPFKDERIAIAVIGIFAIANTDIGSIVQIPAAAIDTRAVVEPELDRIGARATNGPRLNRARGIQAILITVVVIIPVIGRNVPRG